MKTYRKSARYRVQPSFPLLASIKQSRGKTYKLISLGAGGFGFYSSGRDAELAKLENVDVALVLGDRKYELKGSITYCTFVRRESGFANYFGLKFQDMDPKVESLLRLLIENGVQKGHLVPA